jgi:hypothetical protein
MALIKKIDVDNYFATKRATRLDRISLGSKPVPAVAEPDKRPADALNLIGNRTEETFSSSASIPITSVSIPSTFDSGRNRLLRPPGNRQE